MRVLLDSHVLLWWMADDPRLTPRARDVLQDAGTEPLWSTASTWELAIKASLGKLRLGQPLGRYLEHRLGDQGISILPVQQAHAAAVEELPWHHRDPFDRLLIAQAGCEKLSLLSGDPLLQRYDVPLVW